MTKPLRLFNTLSAAVEPLTPLAPPEVGLYACGPTVYNRAHVGNFRSFVAAGVDRFDRHGSGRQQLDAAVVEFVHQHDEPARGIGVLLAQWRDARDDHGVKALVEYGKSILSR